MRSARRAVVSATFLVAVTAGAGSVRAQLASFSGALGFGAAATGGRTGSIYHVTNTNDSGAGSFRDAVSGSNRIIVFDVGGYVDLLTPVSAKSNLTILGQTAPGDGFGVYGAEVSFNGQSNDIVRYLRFRDTTQDPGYAGSSSTSSSSSNCINIGSSNNMIFDHVSCEFAAYNNIDAATAPNLTFQNSIVAAPIASQRFNFHWEGGGSAGNWGAGTFINNVFVDGHNRSILAKGDTQFVNNTIYNYQAGFTSGDSSGNFRYDILNNEFVAGPSTSSSSDNFYQVDSTQSAFATGNNLDSNADGVLNGGADNSVDGATVLSSAWSPTTANLPLLTATASYNYNIAHAGASLKHDATTYNTSLGYDQVDAQMISNVATLGTGGRLWTSETQTALSNNGLGVLNSGAKPTDTDNDGIPDAWESAHGMNPNVADSTKLNPLGYTMIEQYANELADSTETTRVWNSNGGEWNTTAKWTGAVTPIPYDIASVQGAGAGTDGLVTVSTSTPTAYQLYIGGNGDAAGEKVQVTAGKLDVQDTIYVGNTNAGTLEIDGGLVTVNNVIIGNTVSGTTYNGSVILNGGTLQTNNLVLGGGSPGAWTSGGSITFNGGTLQASGTLNVTAPATINAGGATVDTNGNAATMSGVLSGPGALNKIGAGVLSLSGANSFLGGLNLKAGEVGVSSDSNLSTGNINFLGGILQIQGNTLTNLDSHVVNWSSFNGGFDVASATNTVTISQNISGAGSLSVNGSGILFLTGTNSYSGGTFLNGGFLEIASTASLGGSTAPLNFTAGSLYIPGTSVTNIDSYNVNWSSFNGGFNIASAANTFTIGQVLGGSGSFTKSGPGVLVLNAANTFTGTTTITGGTLRLGNALALQKSTLSLTTAGVTLDYNGFNPTFGGLSGTQGLDLKGAIVTVGGNNSTTTYSGVISDSIGNGTFVKSGSGTLTLSGSSTFTGPIKLSGGKISVTTLTSSGKPGPLGMSSSAAGNFILDGGTLQYLGSGMSIDRLFTLTQNGGTLSGDGSGGLQLTNTGSIIASGTGNRTLTLVGGSTGNSLSFGIGDPSSGVTSLTMNDSGRWILNGGGALTYSGTTTVAAGTLLDLNKTNILPFGAGKGNLSLSSGGIFEMNGVSNNINALVGAGNLNNRSGTATLTLGNGDASGTFSGTITVVPLSGTSTLNLVKTGLGTEILSGANTVNGTTTISSGVLQFNSAGSDGGSGATVTVNSGAVVAAGYAMDQTFLGRIKSTSTGVAALALTSANSLNFSTPSLANVSFGAIGSISYTGTLTPSSATYRVGGAGGTLTLPSSQLTGANGVVVIGPGSVVASGADSYSGATAINSGTFEIASPGSIASTSVSTAAGAIFTVDSGAAISASTNLTNAGTANSKNASQTIATLNGAGTLNLNPTALTVSGGGSYSGAIAGTGSVKVTGGSMILTGANSYSGATPVTGGGLTIDYAGSVTSTSLSTSSGATLNVNGTIPSSAAISDSGVMNFGANSSTGVLVRTVGSLGLNSGGTATIATPSSPGNRTVLVTGALNIAGADPSWNGELDLAGNDLIVRNGVLGDVTSQLAEGFNSGAGYWNGAGGIVSSSAAGDSRFLTTLGVRNGGSAFDGVSTSTSDVLVKYTYYGDADLSGTVDGADYQQIDNGFGNGLTGWSNGDFNYDGVVNGSDFALIDNTFNQLSATSANPLSIVAGPADLVSAVPEPGVVGLIAVGAIALRRRCRR